MRAKILKQYPPNYEQIRSFFPVHQHEPIFAFGDYIYTPHAEEIPEDIIVHEHVHLWQQKQYQTPEIWWNKYIFDKEFRKHEETEAYNEQYKWVKKNLGTKASEEALFEYANNLSSNLYRLNISYNEASKAIKKYGKAGN